MPEIKLTDIDPVELSLTVAPAVQEDFIMTKSALEKALPKDSNDDDEDDGTPDPKLAAKPDAEPDPEKEKKPTFNFDKADEQTKGILAAVGQALLNISGQAGGEAAVPAEIATFAKSAAALAPKKADDSLIAFAKSAFPGLVEAIQAPMTQEISGLQSRLTKVEDEKELDEMRKIAETLPGDPEVIAKRLITFHKNLSAEEFDAHITEQRALKTQVEKSELFKRQSSNHTALSGTAEDAIMRKAETMIAKGEHGVTDLGAAIDVIARTEPQLYANYQEEVRGRKAR